MTDCLKCGHDITQHTINVIGKYEYMEITCNEPGEEYGMCSCDAGFRKVAITKEFKTMEG